MAVTFCYVTAGSRDEALSIGRTVVQERLAACANVLDGVTSIYWWQGALEQAGEAALILKTRAELVERLTGRIRELHSYECPCVVALPIAAEPKVQRALRRARNAPTRTGSSIRSLVSQAARSVSMRIVILVWAWTPFTTNGARTISGQCQR